MEKETAEAKKKKGRKERKKCLKLAFESPCQSIADLFVFLYLSKRDVATIEREVCPKQHNFYNSKSISNDLIVWDIVYKQYHRF